MIRDFTRQALAWLLAVACIPFAAAADHPDPSYFVGRYWVVGRLPDSGTPYSGDLKVYLHEGEMALYWEVGDEVWTGRATFVESELVDTATQLRITVERNGHPYEGTLLWRNDLDNYPRVSGYIYDPKVDTDKPGLEAWFPNPESP